MNTIIEQIRAEIEIKRYQNWESENSYYDVSDIKNASICRHKRILCEYFLSFISDLEKEEKLKEGLEKEYKDYVENDPVYSKLVNGVVGLSIARHFAKWGAEHLKK